MIDMMNNFVSLKIGRTTNYKSIARPGLDVHQSENEIRELVIWKLELEDYPKRTGIAYSSIAGGW